MLLRLFKTSSNYSFIVYFLFVLLLSLQHFFSFETGHSTTELIQDEFQMPLFDYINTVILNSIVAKKITSFFLIIIHGVLLFWINRKFSLTNNSSYLVPTIYTLVIFTYFHLSTFSPLFLANIFVIISLERFFYILEKKKLTRDLFFSLFFLSIGSLIFIKLVFFLPLFFIGLILFSLFNIRTFFITTLSFALPWFIYFAFFFIFYGEFLSVFDSILENLIYYFAEVNFGPNIIFYFSFYSFIVLFFIRVLFYYHSNRFKNKRIHNRKYFYFLFLLFFFSLIMASISFISSAGMEILFILSIPISFVYSYFFINSKSKMLSEVIFSIILFFVIFVNYLMKFT